MEKLLRKKKKTINKLEKLKKKEKQQRQNNNSWWYPIIEAAKKSNQNKNHPRDVSPSPSLNNEDYKHSQPTQLEEVHPNCGNCENACPNVCIHINFSDFIKWHVFFYLFLNFYFSMFNPYKSHCYWGSNIRNIRFSKPKVKKNCTVWMEKRNETTRERIFYSVCPGLERKRIYALE